MKVAVFIIAIALAALPAGALAQQMQPPSTSGADQSSQYPSSSQPSSGQPPSSAEPSSGARPSSAGQPAASQGPQGAQIASDALVGSKVRDAQGKDIGKVKRLMLDPAQGKITGVVISMGGTFGIGSKDVSVPWESVKVQRDQQNLVVTVEQPPVEQAPSASPRTDQRDQKQNRQR